MATSNGSSVYLASPDSFCFIIWARPFEPSPDDPTKVKFHGGVVTPTARDVGCGLWVSKVVNCVHILYMNTGTVRTGAVSE